MPITAEEKLELLKWVMTLDTNSTSFQELVQIKAEFENEDKKRLS